MSFRIHWCNLQESITRQRKLHTAKLEVHEVAEAPLAAPPKIIWSRLVELSCLTIKYFVNYNRVLCSQQSWQEGNIHRTEAVSNTLRRRKTTEKRKTIHVVDCQAVYLRGNNFLIHSLTLCFPSSTATQSKARLKWPTIKSRKKKYQKLHSLNTV